MKTTFLRASVFLSTASGLLLLSDLSHAEVTSPIVSSSSSIGLVADEESPLTLDFASSFDFGNHDISNEDQFYFAKAQDTGNTGAVIPNYVQITDNRGTKQGWSLSVKQDSPFTAENVDEEKGKILEGAEIILNDATIVSFDDPSDEEDSQYSATTQDITLLPGISTVVMNADKGKGAGLYITRWGSKENIIEDGDSMVSDSVKLKVPGETFKKATSYHSTLTWVLSNRP